MSAALLVSGAALSLHANQPAMEELSLKSLFDLEVTVAAKSKERLVTTSGTVYVFTQEEFRQYGWRTVVDALSAVPGVNIANTYRYSDGGHRGWAYTTNDMSETIVLLNGREITVARNGRAGQVLQGVPLNNVKRIEVLQGPQSTLYGSHALQGVVNIITETNEAKFDDMGATLAYQRGDVNTEQSDLKAHIGKGEAYIGVAGHVFYTDRDWDEHKKFFSNPANTQYTDGSKAKEALWPTENLHNQNPEDYNNHEESYNIQGYTEFNGFYAGYFDYRLKNLHTPGLLYTGHMTGDFQERNVYFGYKNNSLIENLDFFAEAERVWQRDMYFNFKPHSRSSYLQDTAMWITSPMNLGSPAMDSINEAHFYLGEVQRYDTRIWKVRAQANYMLNLADAVKQDFVVGVEYANAQYFVAYGVNTLYPWQDSDDLNWPNTKSTRISAYVQDQASVLDEMIKVTAGLRVNKEDYMNVNVTPRISVGFEPIKNTVLKFNLTHGFRSLAFDQFAQAATSQDPTKMRQIEAGVAQRLSLGMFDALGAVSYYNMRKVGAYTRRDKASGLGVEWVPGKDTTDISGFEGQLKFSLNGIPKNNISGFVGANYVLRELDLASDKKTKYFKEDPQYTAKIGISDRIFDLFDVGLFVNVMSPLEYEVGTYNDSTGGINQSRLLKTQDMTGVLSLTLGVGPYELFDAIDARINVQIGNLLNEQYYHVVRRWGAGDGMLQPPRTFAVKAEFSL
jgi:outer membrane receptor protein involved in Fe transport